MADAYAGGQTRPKAGTAIGILNIIFSGFGIIGGFVSLGMFSLLKSILTAFGDQLLYEYGLLLSTLTSFFTIIIVITLVQFVIYIIGLVGGIGLLKKKYWSVLVCTIYAGATIVLLIANYFATKQLVVGALENPMVMNSIPANEVFILDIVKTVIPAFTGLFSIIIGSAYPIIVLVLLNRAKVKDFYSAMRNEGDV